MQEPRRRKQIPLNLTRGQVPKMAVWTELEASWGLENLRRGDWLEAQAAAVATPPHTAI